MDNYALYHGIKNIQSVATQYTRGIPMAKELEVLAEQIASRSYRVAVIGEFKRGKSSLVNCILGTEILPTDILPTTAVVNRIVYSNEQRIEICYKDGTVKTTSVEELSRFATKENEENASLIREIVVYYPAVFCQNNIQLLDTPGLNDDEFMDSTTLEVLDRIDTAIVTTHSSYPVSETEQRLICQLIEQENIHHLSFVGTFIDRVSNRPKEQDRVVELIRSRLSEQTLAHFRALHPDEPELQQKAERILAKPVVFAVSSQLAMEGFVSGDKDMLDESRFPHFKYELAALLTANQEKDMLLNAHRQAQVALESFPQWHGVFCEELKQGLDQVRSYLQQAQNYQKNGCPGLTDRLLGMERRMEVRGVLIPDREKFNESSFMVQATRQILLQLLQLDPEQQLSQEDVVKALNAASANMYNRLDWDGEIPLLRAEMDAVTAMLEAAEKDCGFWGLGLRGRLAQKLETWHGEHAFPRLDTKIVNFEGMFQADILLKHLRSGNAVNLTRAVSGTLTEKAYPIFKARQTLLRDYIASWRSVVLKHNQENKAQMSGVCDQLAGRLRNIRKHQESEPIIWQKNLETMKRALEEISREL